MMGGATLESHPSREDETPKMNGSALLAFAESKEDVMTLLRNDIYTVSGVWNLEKVCICTSWDF